MSDFTERQKNIIEAAINIIAQKGIQQLTIKNISKRLGISEPAIYRHFDSKMDILHAILLNFRKTTKMTIDRINAMDASALMQIEIIFSTHFAKFAANPALAATIFSEEIFQNDKRLSQEVASIMELSQNAIEGLIQKGQQGKEISADIPAGHLAILIMGALRLIVTRWRLGKFSFDLETEGNNLWKTIEKLVAQRTKGTLNNE